MLLQEKEGLTQYELRFKLNQNLIGLEEPHVAVFLENLLQLVVSIDLESVY